MSHLQEALLWLTLATCGSADVATANPFTGSAYRVQAWDGGWCCPRLRVDAWDRKGRRTSVTVRYYRNVFRALDPVTRSVEFDT